MDAKVILKCERTLQAFMYINIVKREFHLELNKINYYGDCL